MKRQEKWAAFNVTPCTPSGHELRNRHGTCLMCDTQTVAHLLRAKLAGYVYVAQGASGRLMKIGFSANPFCRLEMARYEGWGGYHDWRLVALVWSSRAGRLEGVVQKHFYATNVPLRWIRNGKHVVAREAFAADLLGRIYQMTLLCEEPANIAQPDLA